MDYFPGKQTLQQLYDASTTAQAAVAAGDNVGAAAALNGVAVDVADPNGCHVRETDLFEKLPASITDMNTALDKLQTAADAGNTLVRRAMQDLAADSVAGLDIASQAVHNQLDLLVPSVITQAEADLIKSASKVTIPQTEYHIGRQVTYRDMRQFS